MHSKIHGDMLHEIADEKVEMVTANKTYDTEENHLLLKRKKKHQLYT